LEKKGVSSVHIRVIKDIYEGGRTSVRMLERLPMTSMLV